MIHSYIQPVILPIHEHVIPLVLIGAAVIVDENAVNEAAVIAKTRQKHGQKRGKVRAVAAALEHHVVGKRGDIDVGIAVIDIHAGQIAGRALGLEFRAQDLRLIVRIPLQRVSRGGRLRFVEPCFPVPVVAGAVLDDPVVDGLNFLRVGLSVGRDLL